MLCITCRRRDANPANFSQCDDCDDANRDAFATSRFVIGDAQSDRTTRDLLEIPWRE